MRFLLEKRRPPGYTKLAPEAPVRTGALDEIRFVPARWLVLLLGIASTALRGGKLAKFGFVGLVWSFAPRPVKFAVGGLAAAGVIVVLGALAAIALLALQIS
jgi:hypothetical protein